MLTSIGIFEAVASQSNVVPTLAEEKNANLESTPYLATPTPIPTYNSTSLPTISPLPLPTSTPTTMPSPLLTPEPKVNVTLSSGYWDYTGLPFIMRTQVSFNVTINDPKYSSLLNELAIQNMSEVFLGLYNGTAIIWSPDGTDSIPQYGVQANNYTVTNVSLSQFTITLYPSGNATASHGSSGLPHQLADSFNRWLSAHAGE